MIMMKMSEKRFSSNFYEEEGRTITYNGYELTQNEVVDLLNEQQARIKELEEEKKYYLKKAFLFEKGIAIHLQKEEQMELYTYVDLEMKR